MAQIPLVTNRQPIGSREYPIAPPAVFGAGIAREMDRSAEVFQNIQAGHDAAESAMLVGEGSAGLSGVLVDAKTNISDPEEYKAFTQSKIEEVYQGTLEKASSPVVRRQLEARLADNRAKAEIDARYGYFGKKQDRALAQALEAENQFKEVAITGKTPEERKKALDDYGTMIGQLTAAGYLDADKAQARIERFNDKVEGDSMGLRAQQDPLGFTNDMDQGAYAGAGALNRQRALDIAEKTLNQRVVREKQANQGIETVAERALVARARAKELDEGELREAQAWYGWSEDKVNRILRIQHGLKTPSVGAELLISDAMRPVDETINPTLGDVETAYRKLLSITDKVSADSDEWKAAVNKLRARRDSLTIRGDIQGNRAQTEENRKKSDARRRLNQIADQNAPDMDPERRRQMLGDYRNRIDDSAASDAPGIVDQFEKSLKDSGKARQEQLRDIEGLRGLNKK